MSALGKESEAGDDAEEGGGGDGGDEKAARRELLAERWRLRRDIVAGDRCRDLGDFFLVSGMEMAVECVGCAVLKEGPGAGGWIRIRMRLMG